MSDAAKRLLADLADSPPYPYPRSIIQKMIDRREEMIPELLAVLADTHQRPEHYLEGGNWKVLTFACYLLAQFRVTAAFKPLCALLALPAKTSDDLFGDMTTEDMGNILASVYGGDDRPLRDLVENREVYEYIRGAAVPKCYLCLLHENKISREMLELYAEELLEKRLEREPGHVWDGWTGLGADLGFARLIPLIDKAIDDDLVDPFYYGLDELIRNARSGSYEGWKRRIGLIDDTIEETEWWHCWKKESKRKPLPPMPKYVEPRFGPKVGRNDPCPCGSGKKYKKCCGGAG